MVSHKENKTGKFEKSTILFYNYWHDLTLNPNTRGYHINVQAK